MRRTHVSLLMVLIVVVLAMAACGSASTAASSSSSGSTASSAKNAACNGLSTINSALASLAGTQSNTTVGDVQASQQKVTTALNTISSKIPAASGPLLSQIKSANDQLTAKLAGYPPSTPIGQTSVKVQDVKSAASSGQSKTTAISSALKCP